MSVLRTFYRQQRLFKCNLNRVQTQHDGDTHIPIRGLKNLALGRQFRILFMGRDEFSCLVLEELFKARDVWEEIIIATQPDMYVGRRKSILSVSPLKIFGEKLKLPVHTIPEKKPEFKTWEPPHPFTPFDKSCGVPQLNHLLITASFGRILTGAQLNLFHPMRRLNVHPSLLPAYRGPAPIQHTIINDEKVSGVCIIEMLKKKEGIDAGPVWGSIKMPVPMNANFPGLRKLLAIEGGKLLVLVLRDMIHDKIAPVPQTSAEGHPFAPMISTDDALVNFFTMSAGTISRRHRAFSHQKPLFTHLPTSQCLQLHDLTTTTATSANLPFQPGAAMFNKSTDSLVVRCAEGSLLNVSQVKPEGKRLMTAKDWWNGLRDVEEGGGFVPLGLPTNQ
ncbi:Formyltransferase [Phlegmacium glaucopus]|nr:Formyltransferase [Phlegmacium glaucopus]